jgi:hypothetical protein
MPVGGRNPRMEETPSGGNDNGNAALAYSMALSFADQADTLAIGFGAEAVNRFGMEN